MKIKHGKAEFVEIDAPCLMLKDIERAREAAERSQQQQGQIGGYEVRVIDGERVLVVELKSFPTPEQE